MFQFSENNRQEYLMFFRAMSGLGRVVNFNSNTTVFLTPKNNYIAEKKFLICWVNDIQKLIRMGDFLCKIGVPRLRFLRSPSLAYSDPGFHIFLCLILF